MVIKAIDVADTFSPSSCVDLLYITAFVVAGSECFFSDLSTGFLVSFVDAVPLKSKLKSSTGGSTTGVGVVTS